jgi:hypothetical protein
MLHEGGRAKVGLDHKALRGERRAATRLDLSGSWSDHPCLSGSALLPLNQVHPSAQLDRVAQGIPLRVIHRPAGASPGTHPSALPNRCPSSPQAGPDRRADRIPAEPLDFAHANLPYIRAAAAPRQTRRSAPALPSRTNLSVRLDVDRKAGRAAPAPTRRP